jgi:predicted MFS family arabinose efflux permease
MPRPLRMTCLTDVPLFCSYAWGGVIGAELSWRWAFILEVIPVVVVLPLLWYLPFHRHHAHADIGQAEAGADGGEVPLLHHHTEGDSTQVRK